MYYHLSEYKNLQMLTPYIPCTAIPSLEDRTIKRVCFSDNIKGCLSALQESAKTYYVYTPIDDSELYVPTVDQVRDGKIHGERWSLKNIEVKLLGRIQSYEYISMKDYNSGRGRVTFFDYPYKWIERLNI